MTYFGETLRKAREAKGLTTSQVAEKTHILVQIINAMEHEDFSRIKAAIYGRGFVKLICECLEIDPKPLVAEFMDIYEGRRPPITTDAFVSAHRPESAPTPNQLVPAPVSVPEPEPVMPEQAPELPPVPEPTPTPEPVPTPAPIAPAPEAELLSGITEAAHDPAAQPDVVKGLELFDPKPSATVETPPAVTRAQDIFSSIYTERDEVSASTPSSADKFRRGLSTVSHGVIGTVRSIPRSAWRMSVLIAGALAVIGLLVWGCVVLYRVTERPVATPSTTINTVQPDVSSTTTKAKPAPNTKPKAEATSITDSKPAKPKLRSTGQKVPPLYVD